MFMSINMREQAPSEQPNIIVVDDAPPEIQSEIERMRRLAETAPLISVNPERMGGTPVIGIERLPVASLISHLIAGYTVEEFIEAFDTDRERVYAILEKIKEALDAGWLAEPVDY
jgi:uncharacterized protein (DUF433 family)